jgi:hypothetical protein
LGVIAPSGEIWERETPHSDPDRHSRFVIRGNGDFELHDGTGSETTVYHGRWRRTRGPWETGEGTFIALDFDAFEPSECDGEGFGAFFNETHVAIAYCDGPISGGLEEGFYTSSPGLATPGSPPPTTGQIAFVRDGAIQLANTDGSGLIELSAGPDDWYPAWSPDGSRIAFARIRGDAPGIYVIDADGANLRRRTTGGQAPAWSPDGEQIAYECGAGGGLCRVKVDDVTAPERIDPGPGQLTSPAWSPDGTRIAHSSDWAAYDLSFDIWVIAPDGSGRTPLITHTPAAPNPYEFYQPAWSPDGERIAMVTCPWAYFYCSSSVVSVMNADGTHIVWLATGSGFARPAWAPDGDLIAFGSSNGIEWLSADGSQRGWIVENGASPAWRPASPAATRR